MSAIRLEGKALSDFNRIRDYRGAHPGDSIYSALRALGLRISNETRAYFDHPELYSARVAQEQQSAQPAASAGEMDQAATAGGAGKEAREAALPRAFAARPGKQGGEDAGIAAAFANTAGAPDPAAGQDPGLRHDEIPFKDEKQVQDCQAPAAAAQAMEAAPVLAQAPAAPEPSSAQEDENEARRRRNAEAFEDFDAGSGGDPEDPDAQEAAGDAAASESPKDVGSVAGKARKPGRLLGIFGRRKKPAGRKEPGMGGGGKAAEPPIELLAPDMKRAKAKCRNPYVDASNAYRSRLEAMGAQIPWFKAGIIILGLLSLGIYAENIVVTNRSHIVPYVMTVDSHGFAIASGTAKPLSYDGKGNRALTGTTSPNRVAIGMGDSIDERVIRAALTDFIAKMRDVTPDVQILRDNIKTCYSMIGDRDPSGDTLDRWFSGEDPDTGGMNPLVRAEKYIVHVRFISAVTLSANTMQIDWVETTRDRDGARAMPDRNMRANVTWYAGQLKDEIEQIQRNPFGIYVKEFHVSSLSVVDSGSDQQGGEKQDQDGADVGS